MNNANSSAETRSDAKSSEPSQIAKYRLDPDDVWRWIQDRLIASQQANKSGGAL